MSCHLAAFNKTVTRGSYDGLTSIKPDLKFAMLTARPCIPMPPARGFTLLELLVVLVILGLLAGYVAPKYFSQIGKSEVKTAQAQIGSLEKALDQYRIDTGHYPNTEQGLAALNAKPADEARWDGPYLKKAVPDDPWGKPYQYRMPGEHSEVDIFSFGRDSAAGGSGEGADIGNW
jgi:general secretion pathway protein G